MKAQNVLLLPGRGGSGPGHWQTRWAQRHGYRRVEQHEWDRPLRGDWLARLEDQVLACDEPPVLVADGLACVLVAAWSATSRHAARVRAALLAAPVDPEREDLRARCPTWAPIALQPLAFPAVVVADASGAWCNADRVRRFAHAWGARLVDGAGTTRPSTDFPTAAWPDGQALLHDLMKA